MRMLLNAMSVSSCFIAPRTLARSLSTLFGSFQTPSPGPAGVRHTERGSAGPNWFERSPQAQAIREPAARASCSPHGECHRRSARCPDPAHCLHYSGSTWASLPQRAHRRSPRPSVHRRADCALRPLKGRSTLPAIGLVISVSIENTPTQIRPGDGCCRVPGCVQTADPPG